MNLLSPKILYQGCITVKRMERVSSAWLAILFNENHIKQLHQTLLRHSERKSGTGAGTKPAPTASRPLVKTGCKSAPYSRPHHFLLLRSTRRA